MYSERQRVSIIFTTALSILLVGYYLIYKPSARRIRSLQDKVKGVMHKEDLSKEIGMLSERITAYQERMPRKVDVSFLMKRLMQKISQEQEIALVSIKPLPLEEKNLYVKLSVTLELGLRYNKLVYFIRRLEGDKEIFKIEKIYIENIGTISDKSPQLRVQLTISSPVLPP